MIEHNEIIRGDLKVYLNFFSANKGLLYHIERKCGKRLIIDLRLLNLSNMVHKTAI